MDIYFCRLLASLFLFLNGLTDSEGKRRIGMDLLGESELEIRIESVEMSTVLDILVSGPLTSKRDALIRIEGPKGFGLLTYLQSLHLRVTHKTMDNNLFLPQCKDYIKLNGGDNICGEVKGGDLKGRSLVGSRWGASPSGRALVSVHVDYHSALNSTLLAQLIITPYTDCWSVKGDLFRRCSSQHSFSCIHSNLFCDGEVNCLFQGSLGLDEVNCRTGISPNGAPPAPLPPTQPPPKDKSNYESEIKEYFIPTGFILFLIWGMITLFRKCYKCYRTDFSHSKDDMYHF